MSKPVPNIWLALMVMMILTDRPTGYRRKVSQQRYFTRCQLWVQQWQAVCELLGALHSGLS